MHGGDTHAEWRGREALNHQLFVLGPVLISLSLNDLIKRFLLYLVTTKSLPVHLKVLSNIFKKFV